MESLDFAEIGSVDVHGRVRLQLDGRIVKAQLVDVMLDPSEQKPIGIVKVEGDQHTALRACYYRLADNDEVGVELTPMNVSIERAALVVYGEHKRPKAS